jgi:hypothetical protein
MVGGPLEGGKTISDTRREVFRWISKHSDQLPFPSPIPVVLSIVAGYVDNCTYLGLFGVLVAQVTGSFVLAGTQFIESEPGGLAKPLAIPLFLLRWHRGNDARSFDERAPTCRFSLELGGRTHVGPGFIVYPMKGIVSHWSLSFRRTPKFNFDLIHCWSPHDDQPRRFEVDRHEDYAASLLSPGRDRCRVRPSIRIWIRLMPLRV